MKAKQSFTVYLDSKGNFVSHYSGDSLEGKKEIKIEKGKEVPDEIVHDLLLLNPDYLEIEREAGQFKLTDEERKRFNMPSAKTERPPIVPKHRHSEESLIQLYNKEGKEGLEKLAIELGIQFTPKTSYNKLITSILKESEKRRRGG